MLNGMLLKFYSEQEDMLHNMAALLESKSVEKRRSYYRAYASSAVFFYENW